LTSSSVNKLPVADDDDDDEVPKVDRSVLAVSRPGDLWQIGNYFVLCADALNAKGYGLLLGAKKAQMVFVDPPYNVPIVGDVSGFGTIPTKSAAPVGGHR